LPKEESAAWQRIYREHGPAVLSFLRSRMAGEAAEDLLQETFVRAIRAQRSGNRSGTLENPRAYLLTIARNLLLNTRRDRLDTETLRLDENPAPERRAWSAHATFDFNELGERLQKALASMSTQHRQAFELAILQQHPYRTIARRTGWTLAQVKVNVHRARRHAIRELADYLG
jgi:RNA polymerase sigma-70 factor (ECF subfamily)